MIFYELHGFVRNGRKRITYVNEISPGFSVILSNEKYERNMKKKEEKYSSLSFSVQTNQISSHRNELHICMDGGLSNRYDWHLCLSNFGGSIKALETVLFIQIC